VRLLGLALAILAVLVADFPWRALQDHTHWAHVLWVPFVSPPVRLLDSLLNVLLFVPIGLFAPRSGTVRRTIVRAVLIALPVSLLGEATQLYSHGRFPSATDLVCNLIGAATGAFLTVSAQRRAGWSPGPGAPKPV
jgi:VanZ family protein